MDEQSAGEFFDVLDVFDGHADVEDDEDSPPKVGNKRENVQTKVAAMEDGGEWRGTEDVDVGMSENEDWEDAEDEEDEEDEDEGEEGEGEGDSAVDEDDELRISASDSEDPSPEALADLETFLSTIDPAASHKRKSDEATEPDSTKRRRIADRTEAGKENEFGVRGEDMRRCHMTDALISVQARVPSSWTIFLLHSHLPPLSLSSNSQRNLSRHRARKHKRSPLHYLNEHKNA